MFAMEHAASSYSQNPWQAGVIQKPKNREPVLIGQTASSGFLMNNILMQIRWFLCVTISTLITLHHCMRPLNQQKHSGFQSVLKYIIHQSMEAGLTLQR